MNKKVVLVTGSSSGLGMEIIKKFASNNYNCVINYYNHEKEANDLKKELESKYQIKCLTVKGDISKDEDVKHIYNEIINEFGHLDVLVNNAGIAIDEPIDVKTKENFMRVLEVNLYGTFITSKIFGKLMYDNKNGVIINISSTNGIDSYYLDSGFLKPCSAPNCLKCNYNICSNIFSTILYSKTHL